MARQQGYASLPEDLQTMRHRAHAVRAETIANLDQYLAQFVAQAQANGLIIHPAADAAQAVQVVLDIAHQNGVKLVAKAKTMVGEEIEINHHLQAAGLEVVETDLGEYIVQVRGERPAHIITPAVHLRRADVALTFHEKLGLPYTEDVVELTAAARRILRLSFFKAGIGITGANFGVAESGGLCLLTNEGNGRMVATIPPIHIALLGIERLVPTFEDLALLLALLPRSATGQKLTAYTTLIHRARGKDDPDGPHERHVILVDHGRSAIRGSPLAEALYCIRCGACLNACPVFQELGGHAYVGVNGQTTPYPGPIGAVISPALFGQAEFGHLARASSLCGACKEACPVDIDLPKLLLRVRAGGRAMIAAAADGAESLAAALPILEREKISAQARTAPALTQGSARQHIPSTLKVGLRLFAWLAADARRFAASQRLAGIASRLVAPFSAWLRLPSFTGWGYGRDLPRPERHTFRARWNTLAREKPPWQGLARPTGPLAVREAPAPEPASPTVSPVSLAAQFAAELAALGGSLYTCEVESLAEGILAILRERQISSVVTWQAPHLPAGLLEALEEAGIEIAYTFDPAEELKGGSRRQAGLTGAPAGIADSGSLVLPGGVGRPQTASLVTEIHIAVLQVGDIYANLPQVFTNLREVREAASIVLVSGPSRTADIEMTLTIGVHGPKEIHVFLIK